MVTINSANNKTGASGKVLQGQGVGTASDFSTATYPSTATGTGTILRADGTNWAATTATYPTTTTANQLLVSTATNVVGGVTAGTTGTVLTGVTGAVPAFSAAPAVTSITLSSGTALNSYVEGTWTPTLTGASVAGTTTYSSQNGYYTKVGNIVTIIGTINYSAATGTGSMLIGDLPFTIKNQTDGPPIGALLISSAGTAWPGGTTFSSLYGILNSITCQIYCSGSSSAGGFLQLANTSGGISFTMTYQV